MKIITGIKKPKAFRVVVYGVEGIGKTTLASKLPKPLFLDFENGTHGMDVACADIGAVTFESLMGTLNELISDKHGYQTLVIDSLDILEKAITQQICDEAHQDSIEKVAAYGKGYVFVKDKFGRVLDKLSALADSGMNIVCIGHSQLKMQTLPDEQGAFDRYELKLQKQIAPLVKEWCDTLLFVNYKTTLVSVQGESRQKAQGGKRWVYAEHRPSWDAKHRISMPMPEDCSIEKAADILASTLAGTEVAPKKAVEKTEKPNPTPKPEEPKEAVKTPTEMPVEASEVYLSQSAKEFLKLLKQYGIEESAMRNYAAGKLNDRYGVDFASLPLDKWPEEALNWLNRGFDKIAPKLKN